MTIVDCLFDTNAIVKRYHAEPGTDIIDYLFDKSPRIKINLSTAQVVEVISVFYKLRADNKIDDAQRDSAIDTFLKDISTEKIYLYDFTKRHLTDMDVYQPIADLKPIKFKFKDRITGAVRRARKPRPNTIDTLMLIIMREIKYIVEDGNDEAYLITSDEPVIKVAESLDVKVIDPEKQLKATLPPSLDIRAHKRRYLTAKAIFKDYENEQSLGSSTTVDISEMGMKARRLKGLTSQRIVKFRLEPFNENKTIMETWGEVRWQNASHCGIRLAEPISSEYLDLVAK